jgi:hypothetical protein
MKNLELLTKMLTTDCEYWIVVYEVEHRKCDNTTEIVLVSKPYDMAVSNYEGLLLKDVEKLYNKACLTNIFITNRYAPFQPGIRFSDFARGYPITCDVKVFLIKAFELQSKDLFDYKKIIDELNENNKC